MKSTFVLGVAAVAVLATSGSALAHARTPDPNPARGLVYRGLERAHPSGPCAAPYSFRLRDGRVGCTHGPDPAPAGRDVRRVRTLADLAAASSGITGTTAARADTSAPCFGDGVSGNRVQAVYAYPADGPNNYAALAPLVRQWAGIVDRVFNDSAAETGGTRHVLFVTDAECRVDVARVPLSDAGVASFPGTANDLAAHGHNRPDRKYLVWVDAYVLCGMAEVMGDDRAGPENSHEGYVPMMARVDRGCWGWAERSVEAHELAHTLGAVQTTAPNASALYHCVDEADLMCYDDDGVDDGMVNASNRSVPMQSICGAAHERLLDCNHDDYFHTSPPANSYLADHWNVAQSSFLTSEGPASVPDDDPPVAARPVVNARGMLGRRSVPVRVGLSASDSGGVAGYWVWMNTDGGAFVPVSTSPLPGSFVRRLRPGHTYSFVVQAVDFSGNISAAAYGAPFALRTFQERSASFSPSWRRHFGRRAYGLFQSSSLVRHAQARFGFSGRGISWVARTGRRGGKARVYVDGRYVDTVSLYSARARPRKVVFSRRWGSSRYHTIAIRSVATSRRPRVSVDAFVVLR